MNNKILEPYLPVLKEDKRYYLIAGGRAGGRSFFASQYGITSLLTKPYFRCAIMRYVQGDIKNSIYQDMVDRLEELELQELVTVKENPVRIKFGQNFISGIGFKKSSSDQKAKLKSLAGYTAVIIEEADEVSEEDFMQLDDSLRTIKSDIQIILLFNMPPKEHWINRRWFNLIDSGVEGFYKPVLKEEAKHNTCYIYSNYRDNLPNLNQSTVDNFLRYKDSKPDHFHNMIMGLVPDGNRGRIFKDWNPISVKEYEELDFTIGYGIDYGFSNDPATVVEIKIHNDNIYVRELVYQTGLINKKLSERMEQLELNKDREYIGDGAEPKSNEEMRTYDWNIRDSVKGKGSRKAGVDLLLGKKVYYTEDSENLVKEIQSYCWALNKNKEPTNEPADGNDHVLDAIRGYVFTKSKQKFIGVV